MARKTRDVEASLKKKGFRADNTHHRYFIYFTLAGKKTAIATYTSQGSKEIDDYLTRQMSKQCKIDKKQFGELVDCSLQQDKYEEMLIEGGHIENPDE